MKRWPQQNPGWYPGDRQRSEEDGGPPDPLPPRGGGAAGFGGDAHSALPPHRGDSWRTPEGFTRKKKHLRPRIWAHWLGGLHQERGVGSSQAERLIV